jgi:hypothetical protein
MIASKPAVIPEIKAGSKPRHTIFHPPTIHNIPRAIQVLIMGINLAK